MDTLPKEIVLLILENLTLKEKYKFYMTCNKWAKYRPAVYFTIFRIFLDGDGWVRSSYIAILDSLALAKEIVNEKFINSTDNHIIIGKRNIVDDDTDIEANTYLIEPTWINVINY